MKIKKIIYIIIIGCLVISCNGRKNRNDFTINGKPKYIWLDAEANFKRFATKDSITYYLDKAKETGFNQIVVDVRPIQGEALYRSGILHPMVEYNGYRVERDWDYLQFFIEEARKREMKVTVSTTIFPAGKPDNRTGLVYRDVTWQDKTCIEYTRDRGMIDIKDDKKKVAAFLNPVLPEVQDYCLSFIKEIVSKYDVDAYALDYCRFAGAESDFSEASRLAFEEYIGEKLTDFPADIFTWNDDGTKNEGKYYKQWWEFRSMIIHDFVKKAKEEIKRIKPHIELEYWAASWYGALYENGQNWASKDYDPSADYEWASPNYKNTGFAEHLDTFLCGTYLEIVYGMDEPESIEYGLARARNLVRDKCSMYGTIYALNYNDIEDATYVCLTQSEGLMVFDIVQVIEYNLWDSIKKGIDRAENK